MPFRIKIFILFCLLAATGSVLEVKAADSRLQDLLEKAKARRDEKASPSTSVKEESGYLPANNTKTKEVIHEETYTQKTIEVNQTVPKTPVQNNITPKTNVSELFSQTRTNIENHKQEVVKPVVKPPVVRVAPKTITKTTAKPPVVVPATPVVPAKPAVTKPAVPASKPVVPAKAPAAVKVESPKTTTQVKKDIPAVKVESKNTVSQTANKTQTVSNSKIEEEDHPEEDLLEEDEFMQTHDSHIKHVDDEEAELDQDEGVHKKVIEKKIDLPPRKPIDKATREKEYLDLIKKSLKSLEEDSWNEVKFNMNEAVEYFNREKDFYPPEEIDKFYRITLAFLRFSQGGLELDQGDFADFEDAEAHYLDAQDIIDGVEIKLNANVPIEKELLNIIQTVKKYINEDIEYIEEMIDLS